MKAYLIDIQHLSPKVKTELRSKINDIAFIIQDGKTIEEQKGKEEYFDKFVNVLRYKVFMETGEESRLFALAKEYNCELKDITNSDLLRTE